MRRICELQDPPTAQELYDTLIAFINDIEADVYTLEDLFILLGLTRAFLKENYEVN